MEEQRLRYQTPKYTKPIEQKQAPARSQASKRRRSGQALRQGNLSSSDNEDIPDFHPVFRSIKIAATYDTPQAHLTNDESRPALSKAIKTDRDKPTKLSWPW